MTAPFVVYAQRSRSAWLARFLSFKDYRCYHDVAITMRSLDDVVRFFRQPKTGSAETAAAPGWRILHHHIPNMRAVVVRRPVEDVVDSMMGVDLAGIATYDREKLMRGVVYGARILDQISEQRGVLTVEFADLEHDHVCRAVFEHLLQVEMPYDWWLKWRHINVQADVPAMLRYYQAHRDEIEGFKWAMKAEMRRLVAAGAIGRRAAHAIV